MKKKAQHKRIYICFGAGLSKAHPPPGRGSVLLMSVAQNSSMADFWSTKKLNIYQYSGYFSPRQPTRKFFFNREKEKKKKNPSLQNRRKTSGMDLTQKRKRWCLSPNYCVFYTRESLIQPKLNKKNFFSFLRSALGPDTLCL